MSSNKNISCGLCGRKFKTFSRMETVWHDYEEYEEPCYYPCPEEHAHLVRDYICDDCYNKIGSIVLKQFSDAGEGFIREEDERKKEAHDKYETIEFMKTKFPYVTGGTYYLDDSIRIEQRTKYNKQTVYEWSKKFGIKIEELQSGVSGYDLVTLEEFKAIIKNSVLSNVTIAQINEILNI